MITVVAVREHNIAVLSCGHKLAQGGEPAAAIGQEVYCPICVPAQTVLVRTALVLSAHHRECQRVADGQGRPIREIATCAAMSGDPLEYLQRRARLHGITL
jgi:hypothetical protein